MAAIASGVDTHDPRQTTQPSSSTATAFFKQSIENNGVPGKVVIDKSGANHAGLENMNLLLFLMGYWRFIEIIQAKYLNNIIEQDHRFIKRITRPMKGFKSFHSAAATLQGIEVAHMIRKKQFDQNELPAFQQFALLVG